MEKHKILLELALHRYDEVNKRNDIIDNKSKSMIAFIGVMLTIEFSAIPTILNTLNKTPLNGKRALLLLGIASTSCYLIAILYFISAVNPMKEFKEAPSMKELVSSGKNNEFKVIVAKNIINLKESVEENNKTIECKAQSKNKYESVERVSNCNFYNFIYIIKLEVII